MSKVPSQRWLNDISDRKKQLGQESVKRMAEMFVEEMDSLLDNMVAALRSENIAEARRGAHHLSGNAGSLDFVELGDLAQQIEKCCIKNDKETAFSLIQKAVPIAQRDVSELRRHFGIE